jgi:hypothetical protein
MLTLILLTFSVFFVLWIGDLILTRKVTKKVGAKAEINPLMRKILSFRGKFIWIFKFVEIGLFLYLIYYIQTFSGQTSFYILLVYILFYSILVANNSRVYFQVTKETSGTFRWIFLIISVLLIMFIYLNYLMYSGLTLTYSKLGECQSDYKNVYWECYQKNVTPEKSKELEDILGTLDIKIPKPS